MKQILLAMLIACLGTSLAAQDVAGPVVVRESLNPTAGAVIGQHVALRVDVLFRGAMPHPPRVNLPGVAGLQTIRFETQATTLSETIAGETYAGQRFEFALYPRRGGPFALGPASVTLLDRQGNAIGLSTGQTVTLNVTVPPDVDASGPVVATRNLSLDEQWAPSPGSAFKVGDAIVRTVKRTADDVPGLAMRDLAFPAPEGVRAYVDPPEIDDRIDRGAVTGRRTDRVTYVFERGEPIVLPAASQPWWDLAAGASKTATVSGTTIDVAIPPAPVTTSRAWVWLTVAGAALVVMFGIASRFIWRRGTTGSIAERKAFIALRRACSGADPSAVYRAFARWQPLLKPAKRRRAAHEAAPLDAAMFAGGGAAWTRADSLDLVARLAKLRRSRLAVARVVALPPLNPKGDIEPNETSPHPI